MLKYIVEAIRYAKIRSMFYFICFNIFVINNKRVNRCLIINPVETLNGFPNNKHEIFWKIQSNDEIAGFRIIFGTSESGKMHIHVNTIY